MIQLSIFVVWLFGLISLILIGETAKNISLLGIALIKSVPFVWTFVLLYMFLNLV